MVCGRKILYMFFQSNRLNMNKLSKIVSKFFEVIVYQRLCKIINFVNSDAWEENTEMFTSVTYYNIN